MIKNNLEVEPNKSLVKFNKEITHLGFKLKYIRMARYRLRWYKWVPLGFEQDGDVPSMALLGIDTFCLHFGDYTSEEWIERMFKDVGEIFPLWEDELREIHKKHTKKSKKKTRRKTKSK